LEGIYLTIYDFEVKSPFSKRGAYLLTNEGKNPAEWESGIDENRLECLLALPRTSSSILPYHII